MANGIQTLEDELAELQGEIDRAGQEPSKLREQDQDRIDERATAQHASDDDDAGAHDASHELDRDDDHAEGADDHRPDDARKNVARALEEARRNNRDLQSRYDSDMAVLKDRLDRLQQALQPAAQQQPQQQHPAEPDLPEHIKNGRPTVTMDDDPTTYFQQLEDIGAHRDQRLQAFAKEYHEDKTASASERQFMGTVQAHEAAFVAESPDYYQALNFLRQSRGQELSELGMSPQAIAEQIHRDERWVAAQALQSRRSPAQAIYNIAKARGYTAAAQQAGSETPNAGAAAGDRDEAQQREAAAQRREAGAREARTIGSISGGSGGGKLTAEALAKMPESEFEAVLAKLKPGQRQELFGA